MRYSGNNIKLMVNSMQVNYTDVGPEEAPVIIFIHGFPLNLSMWNMQVEALNEKFRIISYDIRGHGESDAGNDAFSIELFVADLVSFMDSLKISKASLCGLSMGGYIALNAVEHYPERFESMVLCDTTCKADLPEGKEKRMKAVENIITNGVQNYASESVKNLFAPGSFTSNKSVVSEVEKMIANTSELSLCSTLLALSARHETCSKLSEIKVPVLILVGAEDSITPPSAAMFLHESIKNSTLQVIEGAGHLSNLENPEAFNQHLKIFFASVYKDKLMSGQTTDNTILRDLRNKLSMLLSFRSI
ncbi:MAG: alpha/beta fold hydrolase [Paludibacter sp.]|nr:alpha/beta fold hydrolase [Paludibacter sp.]